ncbi:MAG TPA: DMT family transporter [Myxococcaceae bacterium]|nr:DMT family transporter [Myxococcaceae bacterium]
MTTWGYVGLMIVAGALIAFQSPINAALGRSVGVFEASLVSFIIGSLVAAGIVFFFGKGDVRAVTQVPWWQLLGGVLGLLYVTLIIVSVSKIGVTAVMVSGLAGQLLTAMIIDHFGWFGVTVRPIHSMRILGCALLVAAIALINWKR